MNTDQVTSYQSMKQLADTLREKSENLYSLAADVDVIVVSLNRGVLFDNSTLKEIQDHGSFLIRETERNMDDVSGIIKELNLKI